MLVLSMAFISVEVQPVYAATTTVAPSQTPLKRWLGVCSNVGNIMVARHFTYSNSASRKSLARAMASNQRANCARYVSWCLQQYGILAPGQCFYTRGNGSIHKTFKWPASVSVIKVGRPVYSVALKPGDIVCWQKLGHTNIYAGKSATGLNLYYDAGRKATRKGKRGSRFVTTGTPTYYKHLSGATISYVIRINGL